MYFYEINSSKRFLVIEKNLYRFLKFYKIILEIPKEFYFSHKLGKARRLTLMECNNDINSMIDLAKVADLVNI